MTKSKKEGYTQLEHDLVTEALKKIKDCYAI
jgi:hypothetical protein